MIPPGSTIGIIGGGQLGRMLSVAAAQLGYRCHIFDPHEHPCAADVAAYFTRAAFDDVEALRRFGEQVDVVTYEFENLPVEPLACLEDKLRPGTRSLAIAQDRAAEKSFIEKCGARVAPWREVNSLADVTASVLKVGLPLVLKTRRYGVAGRHGRAAEDAFAMFVVRGFPEAVPAIGPARDDHRKFGDEIDTRLRDRGSLGDGRPR